MITNGHHLAPPMHGPCDPGQDKHSSEINLLVGTVVSCTTLRPRPTLLAIADDVVEQRRLLRCSSQELALNGHANCPPSCPVLGDQLPRLR